MKNNDHQKKNADRFTGFAKTYDKARPVVPQQPIEIILGYLEKRPNLVVDLGSGTGLSALAWKGNCGKVIGVEPSFDMLSEAKEKECETISFVQSFGNDTGLLSECADVVVCSQSFHWMEPVSTLHEINRILKKDGVFATIDYDWPPVTKWYAEKEYMNIYKKIVRLETELHDVNDSFVRYDKERHLENMKKSGYFRYCREIVFSNSEECTAERLINLMISQGSLQSVLKLHPDLIKDDIEQFRNKILKIFGEETFDIDFSYRMRVGIK